MHLVVFKFVLVRVVNSIDYLDYNCKKKCFKKNKITFFANIHKFSKNGLGLIKHRTKNCISVAVNFPEYLMPISITHCQVI